MGYSIEQNGSSFKIKGEHLANVLKAFQALQSSTKTDSSLRRDIRDCKTIDEFMDVFGWKFKYGKPKTNTITLSEVKTILTNLLQASKDDQATQRFTESTLEEILNRFPEEVGVVDIEFEGENSWKEKELFTALAPYVEKDSYIEMSGDEGEKWRYVFDGVSFAEKKPNVQW